MGAHKRQFEWNARLERRLRAAIGDGMSYAECARLLGAAPKAIAKKARQLGLAAGRLDLSSGRTGMFGVCEGLEADEA